MGKPIGTSLNANVSTNQVKWDGPNIPCIDLCTGDTISTVLYKIATHLCSLVTELSELETLTFDCLIQGPLSCNPKDYSLKAIFEVLIANDCKLKDLIDIITDQVNNNEIPIGSLDLKCLVPYLNALFVTSSDYTLNDLLQSFINILCDHETKITDIIERIQALEVLIKNLQNIVIAGGYIEPDLTSCLSSLDSFGNPIPIKHSDLTPILAQFACSIRTDLGSATDVANTIAKQCLSSYLTNTEIIQNADNLAEDNLNKWVIICDLLTRIKFMEDNCCAPSCNDITIGFSATYNPGSSELTLTFANSTGTTIPIGFVDNGSTIQFIDFGNNVLTLPIDLENGLIWVSPALMLDFTHPINVIINSSFIHQINGLKCIDNFSQTIPAQDIDCKICKLCAINGSIGDQISLTYFTASNLTPTTVILEQEACLSFELPNDKPTVTNISVMTPGSSISLIKDGDCTADIILPTLTQPTCWFFEVPEDLNQNGFSIYDVDHNSAPNATLLANTTCPAYNQYLNITTSLGTFPISGKTSFSSLSTIVTNAINQSPNLPTGLPPVVSLATLCTAGYYQTQFANGTGEYNTGDVVCTHTEDLGASKIGFFLEILGQLPGQVPEIEIITPNSVPLYLKGQTNNCNCPT